jgi:DNA-binding transcriptional regulator YhcF (GntR family)
MNILKLSAPRLPGSAGFIRRSPMFRNIGSRAQQSPDQWFERMVDTLRSGSLRPGDGFPNSRQLAALTGASPIDTLKVVTRLLQSGWVKQLATGQLLVARAGEIPPDPVRARSL